MERFNRFLILLLLALFAMDQLYGQNYAPPAARVINWNSGAGSDLWNGGHLPVYPQVTCTPLNEDGTTDDSTNIQNCVNSAAAGTGSYATCHAAGGCAVFLPAGTIYLNGTVRLKSNVVVRGAGSATLIKYGLSGDLDTQIFSTSSTSTLNPTAAFSTLPTMFTLSGAPQKGDTTVTCATGCSNVSVNSFIKIASNDDPSLISNNMNNGTSYYKGNSFGDNTGYYLLQQIVQVTACAGCGATGAVFTLSKPLYFTPFAASVTTKDASHNSITEPAGVPFNVIQFPTQKAGYEYFHITGGFADIANRPMIRIQGCLYCWEVGVEADTSGSGGEASLTRQEWTYGFELRDGYYHDQRDGSGGSGYGIYFEWPNTDAKVENNIVRHLRHGIIYQGSETGIAVLFNYVDDLYTDDLTYLGSARGDHGAHPYMDLWEGNVMSHLTISDDCWGTTSAHTLYRNWLWGDETGNWTVPYPGTNAATPTGSNPSVGFDALDAYTGASNINAIGNVLGNTGLHTTWSGANLRGNNPFGTRANPAVYSYAGVTGLGTGTCDSITDMSPNPSTDTTSLNHGNWDYKTNGVAYWEGGANHTLDASMYYTSEPTFLSNAGKPWPLEGPESNPTINTNPAEDCWIAGPSTGGSFNAAACYAAIVFRPAPTGFKIGAASF
jgi:hypothetical protein